MNLLTKLTASQAPNAVLLIRLMVGLFLKLGTTAFGGPAALIAMMEDEVVRRRQWLTRDEFLHLLGATNLIPGPNSTEMAIHIGHRRAGLLGLLVAGSCFFLPATLIVMTCAWAYVRFGKLPQAEGLLYGIKRFGRIAQGGHWASDVLWAAGSVYLTAWALHVSFMNPPHFLKNLLSCRKVGVRRASKTLWAVMPLLSVTNSPVLVGSATAGTVVTAAATAFGLWPMFLFFLKVGSVLFGRGYVPLAFLRTDLVDRWHWLTEGQLLDAIALGQLTPGPVFTTATFIGYLLAGTPGAALATIGIFLPAFFFVAISGPLLPRLRRSPFAGAFLDGVNVASLALMAVVTWQLGRVALTDWLTVAIALVGGVLLFRFRINSAWLVLGGAVLGFAVSLLHG